MVMVKQLVLVVLLGFVVRESHGRFRRCYVCRSRGDLGDCKDPFQYNETTIEDVKGVEAAPCASGWCAKITEGENDDFDVATERLCIQRPPIDGEERCAHTILEKKNVYMCFCHGDLCNAAAKLWTDLPRLLGLSLAVVLLGGRERIGNRL